MTIAEERARGAFARCLHAAREGMRSAFARSLHAWDDGERCAPYLHQSFGARVRQTLLVQRLQVHAAVGR